MRTKRPWLVNLESSGAGNLEKKPEFIESRTQRPDLENSAKSMGRENNLWQNRSSRWRERQQWWRLDSGRVEVISVTRNCHNRPSTCHIHILTEPTRIHINLPDQFPPLYKIDFKGNITINTLSLARIINNTHPSYT